MSFAQAVQAGAMVEPDRGEPEMPPLLADLNALGVPLTAIVEHDLYPAPPGVPLPIATRTQQLLQRVRPALTASSRAPAWCAARADLLA